MDEPDRTPLIVVRGDASAEEVAALVVVLQAAAAARAAAASPQHRPRSEWSAPLRRVRDAHAVGPAGWRSSALPR